MKPILQVQALKFKSPSLFASNDFKRLTLVIPIKNKDCFGSDAFDVYTTRTDLSVHKDVLCAN